MKDPVLKLQLMVETAPFKLETSGGNLDFLSVPEWPLRRGGVLVKVLNAIDSDLITWGPDDDQEGFAQAKRMWNTTWLYSVIDKGTIFYLCTVERGDTTFVLDSVELEIT